MKFQIIFLIALVFTLYQVQCVQISGSELENRMILKDVKLDAVSADINYGEELVVWQLKPENHVYEVNLYPKNYKDAKKHNAKTKQMCQVEQSHMNFYDTPNTYTPAFDQFFENGRLKDPHTPVPMLVNYVRTEKGIIAIDNQMSLIHFDLTGEPNQKYLKKSHRVEYLANQADDSLPKDFDFPPQLAYSYLKVGDFEKHATYLIWPDACFLYTRVDNQPVFTKMDAWVSVTEIFRVRTGHGEGVKEMQSATYASASTMFIAAGESGLIMYNINPETLILEIPQTINQAAFEAKGFNFAKHNFSITDVDHFRFENEIFVLEKGSGVMRIKLQESAQGNTVFYNGLVSTITDFFLMVDSGVRLSHYTHHEKRSEVFKKIQQSFMILSEGSNNVQWITEFDYNVENGEWFEMGYKKYSYHFQFQDVIMGNDFAVVLGKLYIQVVRHSIFTSYTDNPHHLKPLAEQYEHEMQNTYLIPGLIDAEFFHDDYHQIENVLQGKHTHMVGIAAHDAILYNMKEIGAKIKCVIPSQNEVKPGSYIYQIIFYENFCEDGNGDTTLNDYVSCKGEQLIDLNIKDTMSKKMPWWGVLLIIILVFGILGGCGFGGYKLYKARKEQAQNTDNIQKLEDDVNEIENNNKKQKYEIFKNNDDEEQ